MTEPVVSDDEIPDFDDSEAAEPAGPVHLDAKGRPYAVGMQVKNVHNLMTAVVTGMDALGIFILYDDEDSSIRIDGRHAEIVDGAPRCAVARPAPAAAPTVVSEISAVLDAEELQVQQDDLRAAQAELEVVAAGVDSTGDDGLGEAETEDEVFYGADDDGPPEELETVERVVDPLAVTAADIDPNEPPPFQIFCGDGPDGLLSLPEVDHVFVDVPYSKDVDDGNEADNTRDNSFGFAPMDPVLMERTAQAIGARCRRWCLLMTSDDEVWAWCQALQRAGMLIYRIGHWVREGTKPQMDGTGPAQAVEYIIIAHSSFGTQRWNGGGKRALWHAPIVHKEQRRHPTQKPTRLLKQLFEDFTDPGDLIADVMAGSFESGLVAWSMGRRYVGWDIDPKYVDEARELFKMPLFDRAPLQASLFAQPRASTRVAQIREEMEREILRAIKSEPGIKVSEIMQRVGASDRSEVTRPLAKMRKKMLVRQEGKTAGATYYPLTLQEREQLDQAARAAAATEPPTPPSESSAESQGAN